MDFGKIAHISSAHYYEFFVPDAVYWLLSSHWQRCECLEEEEVLLWEVSTAPLP